MKKIRVFWTDAVIYSRHVSEVNRLPKMETAGVLYRESTNYVVIKRPRTVRLGAGRHLVGKIFSFLRIRRKPTFLYLPKRMIDEIDDC